MAATLVIQPFLNAQQMPIAQSQTQQYSEGTLLIQNLDRFITESMLFQKFSTVGRIQLIKLKTNQDGNSSQVATIEYFRKEDAEQAIDKFNNRAYFASNETDKDKRGNLIYVMFKKNKELYQNLANNQVYIQIDNSQNKKLDPTTIQNLFTKHGNIASLKLKLGNDGNYKYGILTYETLEAKKKLLEEKQQIVDGNNLTFIEYEPSSNTKSEFFTIKIKYVPLILQVTPEQLAADSKQYEEQIDKMLKQDLESSQVDKKNILSSNTRYKNTAGTIIGYANFKDKEDAETFKKFIYEKHQVDAIIRDAGDQIQILIRNLIFKDNEETDTFKNRFQLYIEQKGFKISKCEVKQCNIKPNQTTQNATALNKNQILHQAFITFENSQKLQEFFTSYIKFDKQFSRFFYENKFQGNVDIYLPKEQQSQLRLSQKRGQQKKNLDKNKQQIESQIQQTYQQQQVNQQNQAAPQHQIIQAQTYQNQTFVSRQNNNPMNRTNSLNRFNQQYNQQNFPPIQYQNFQNINNFNSNQVKFQSQSQSPPQQQQQIQPINNNQNQFKRMNNSNNPQQFQQQYRQQQNRGQSYQNNNPQRQYNNQVQPSGRTNFNPQFNQNNNNQQQNPQVNQIQKLQVQPQTNKGTIVEKPKLMSNPIQNTQPKPNVVNNPNPYPTIDSLKDNLNEFIQLQVDERKQILGKLIFPKVKLNLQKKQQDEAIITSLTPKITGMLIDFEVFEIDDIIDMLENEEDFNERIDEALTLIQSNDNSAAK